MKPVKIMLALSALAALATLAACGPKYPDCENDDHCESHNEVCVDTKCVQCRDNSQCADLGPCQVCGGGNTCVAQAGCCTSDLDCPDGRCWKDGGQAGMCGGECRAKSDCPAGQKCSGGGCVPDVQCTTTADCGEGKRCDGGQCVDASCEMQNVGFDFNEYALRLNMEGVVQANAECLKQRATEHRVEGHCDERGSDEYNLALGQRRAGAVVRQYERLGVPGGLVSTISYGEERPLCTEHNETCWSDNRRVETVTR